MVMVHNQTNLAYFLGIIIDENLDFDLYCKANEILKNPKFYFSFVYE